MAYRPSCSGRATVSASCRQGAAASEGDPMSWTKEIRAARTWQELLALARDYVAKMTPEEVGTLPPTCREMRIKGVDDLYFWHERLAEEFFDRASRGDPSHAHRDLLDFFTVAA